MSIRLAVGWLALTIAAGATSACVPPPPPNLIVIGVTATANEPAPSLTAKAEGALKTAVANHEATLAIYLAQQGASNTRELFKHDVTVRRGGPSGELEADQSLMDQGLAKNLDTPRKVLSGASSDSGQLNLFDLLNDMASVPGRATLIIISSGLQTVNELDLTQYGSELNAPNLVDSLPEKSMHDLQGKTVIFTGLGQAAGPQKALTQPMRQSVIDLWMGVCHKFRADSCENDEGRLGDIPPTSTKPVPTLPVPDREPAIEPRLPGQPLIMRLPCGAMFLPDSPDFTADADATLAQVAARFGPVTRATVVGHTATYGPRDGAIDLSKRRSLRVVDELMRRGVSRDAFTTITGVGYDEPLVPDIDANGHLNPTAAEQNRTVVLMLTNPR